MTNFFKSIVHFALSYGILIQHDEFNWPLMADFHGLAIICLILFMMGGYYLMQTTYDVTDFINGRAAAKEGLRALKDL